MKIIRSLLPAAALAVVFTLLFFIPAFAEGEPPPEVPAAPLSVTQAPSADQPGDAPGADDESTPPESLPLIIAGGELGILANNGVHFKIGSTEYWFYDTGSGSCPPGSEGVTCFYSANPIQDSIDKVATGLLPGDRKVYVNSGQYYGDNTIDGTAGDIYQEQLKGLIGSGAMPNNQNAPVVHGYLQVIHVNSGFTLQGLQFIGSVEILESSGALTINDVDILGVDGADKGMHLWVGDPAPAQAHNGTMALNRVSLTETNGAYINNTASPSAGVTIFSSNFDFSYTDPGDSTGLEIVTNGLASLNGVSASYNDGNGLIVAAKGGGKLVHGLFVANEPNTATTTGFGVNILPATLGNVTLEDVRADHNSQDGIRINAGGAVSLKQVYANDNGVHGLALHGATGDDPSGKSLTALDLECSGNTSTGCWVRTTGAVLLQRVTASGNAGIGLFVQNDNAITLNAVTASGNDGTYGAQLVNDQNSAVKPISILGTLGSNDFSQNSYGLEISTRGKVLLNDVTANQNSGPLSNDGRGIYIHNEYSSGMITLNRVRADENELFGIKVMTYGAISWKQGSANKNGSGGGDRYNAWIDNRYGSSAKPLWIESVVFDSSGDNGLHAHSKGLITLKNVSASGNPNIGVYVTNNDFSSATAGINILCSEHSPCYFSDNHSLGVRAYSNGAIKMEWVHAGSSDTSVPPISGAGIKIMNGAGQVSLKNIWTHHNILDGVNIESRGAITITNIESSGNGYHGLTVTNQIGSGAVKLLRTGMGMNTINGNGHTGLQIASKGAVTIQRLQANDNDNGARIDNCLWDGGLGACTGSGAVTFQTTPGYNHSFSDNKHNGLTVYSKGAISIANVRAEINEEYGVLLQNDYAGASGAGSVLSQNGFTNSFSGNGDAPDSYHGLEIRSRGAITLANFQANGNSGGGVVLDNSTALSVLPVTLSLGDASDNQNGDGVQVSTKGQIKITSVSANGNDMHDGRLFTGQFITSSTPGESVAEFLTDDYKAVGDYWEFNTGQTLTLNGHFCSTFTAILTLQKHNGSTFVNIGSPTAPGGDFYFNFGSQTAGWYRIKVIGSTANQTGNYLLSVRDASFENVQRNGASGFDLAAYYDGSKGGINIATGKDQPVVHTDGNSASGIIAYLRGPVTINRVFSDGNGGVGFGVDNCGWSDETDACQWGYTPITITGMENGFNNNAGEGIIIFTGGAVLLNTVQASGSGHVGLSTYNSNGVYIESESNVTITTSRSDWTNIFDGNVSDGLEIFAGGAVLINRVQASDNGDTGVEVDNTWAESAKAITITSSAFNDNIEAGILASSPGAITLNTVVANDNGGNGAYLEAGGYGFNAPVTTIKSHFNDNDELGIEAYTESSITWNSSSAQGNADRGAWLSAEGSITMLSNYGWNDFSGNGDIGVKLGSNGNITLNNVRANGSLTYYGLAIEGGQNVTINNSLFHYNAMGGLGVFVKGAIALNNVSVFANGLKTAAVSDETHGAYLESDAGAITVKNSVFTGNGDSGILWGGVYPTLINSAVYGNNIDYLNGDDTTSDLNIAEE